MRNNDGNVEVTFYIQIEPEFETRWGETVVRSAKAVNMTQKRPAGRQRAGTIMAPITMRIPRRAFLPLSPKVVVDVPEEMLVSAEAIEVEASEG